MTRKELAEKIGVSPQLISGILTKQRNVTIDVLTKLSILFGVTTDYLLNLSATEDTETLQNLVKKKESLEKHARELHTELVEAQFGEEYQKKLQEVQELARQINYLDTCIKRSLGTPLKVPTVGSDDTVYQPFEGMDAEISIVAHNGTSEQLGVPCNTVFYLKQADRATPGKLYVVRYGDRLALTTNPDNPTEVIGEVTYLLLPSEGYLRNCAAPPTQPATAYRTQ